MVIAEAKQCKNIMNKLELKKADGLKRVFRMVRQSQKDKLDVFGVSCIRGIDGELKII